MARVLIKQQFTGQELIVTASVALVTLGGIVESLFGFTIIGWGCLLTGFAILFIIEKAKIWHSPILIPLVMLAILSILTYFITTSTEMTLTQLSRLWAGIFVYLVYSSWATTKQRQILLILGLGAIGLLLSLSLPFIVDWNVAKSNIIPQSISQMLATLTVTTNTVHPNILASLIILFMPIALAYLLITLPHFRHKNPPLFWLVLVVAGVMAMALVLSQSRAGLLAAGVSAIFLLWFCHYKKTAKILAICVTVVMGIFIFISRQSAGQTSSDVLNADTFAFRIKVWEIAAMMLQDFPFTGVGMGTFNDTAVRLYPTFNSMTTNPSAHNLFLQIGVELGLFGVIAMTAVYIIILFMGKKSIQHFAQQQDTISWAMSAGLTTGIIAILLHGISDINVWGTRGTFAPWMVMGLISAIYINLRTSPA